MPGIPKFALSSSLFSVLRVVGTPLPQRGGEKYFLGVLGKIYAADRNSKLQEVEISISPKIIGCGGVFNHVFADPNT